MEPSIFTQFSSAGGEKLLSCKGRNLVELLALAVEAAKTGAKIVLYDLSELDRASIERIAHAGKGNVLFDLR
jgi:hypothetical protein